MSKNNFPLFNTPIDLAHSFWKKVLTDGDIALDATCGNGKDSLILSSFLQEKQGCALICVDIQEKALEKTKALLQEKNPDFFSKTTFLLTSHEHLPEETPLKLIVYNLGYLPGGDKSLTTQTSSTLKSLLKAVHLLSPGGLISITCYPGHPEGKKEHEMLLSHFSSLDAKTWSFTCISWQNRRESPCLLLLQKALP